MRLGKLTRTAWQRSVRKQLHIGNEKKIFSPGYAESCTGYKAQDGTCFVWTEAHAAGDSGRTGYYAVLQAAGELAAKGVLPEEASIRILLPGESEEEKLKELTAGIAEACGRMNIQMGAFQGEVTPAVRHTVVCVCVSGIMPSSGKSGENPKDRAETANNKVSAAVPAGSSASERAASGSSAGTGAEILLCGYAGLEGTLRILDETEDELSGRFVSAFLDQTRELKKELVTPGQILPWVPEMSMAVRQIGSGGILAALWEMAEEVQTGFEIDMANIALKQETVEICEFYRLNPYQMTSAGSFLILTTEAERVIEILEKAGARAGRLGVAKAQNARVITSGEEIRYLDRPAPDELVKWMAQRRKTGPDES